MFAAAPEATLLCKLWCHPSTAATNECQHHDTAIPTTIDGDVGCGTAALNAASFVREDSRASAGHDSDLGVPLPRHRLIPPTGERDIGRRSDRAWTFDRRPRETALRL
jgi:hypothetical protein